VSSRPRFQARPHASNVPGAPPGIQLSMRIPQLRPDAPVKVRARCAISSARLSRAAHAPFLSVAFPLPDCAPECAIYRNRQRWWLRIWPSSAVSRGSLHPLVLAAVLFRRGGDVSNALHHPAGTRLCSACMGAIYVLHAAGFTFAFALLTCVLALGLCVRAARRAHPRI
jgi:hypothetical protein